MEFISRASGRSKPRDFTGGREVDIAAVAVEAAVVLGV